MGQRWWRFCRVLQRLILQGLTVKAGRRTPSRCPSQTTQRTEGKRIGGACRGEVPWCAPNMKGVGLKGHMECSRGNKRKQKGYHNERNSSEQQWYSSLRTSNRRPMKKRDNECIAWCPTGIASQNLAHRGSSPGCSISSHVVFVCVVCVL